MTIHFATTFFDKDLKDSGFVIGSDSAWEVMHPEEREQLTLWDMPIWREKAFRGKNYIGLFMGYEPRLTITEEDWINIYENLKKKSRKSLIEMVNPLGGLDNIFSEISEGKDYSGLDTLKNISYTLLIARRNGRIELFVINSEGSNTGLRPNTAHIIYGIYGNAKPESIRYWFLGPAVPQGPIAPKRYVELEHSGSRGIESAINSAKHFLQLKDEDLRFLSIGNEPYSPGPPNIYVVSFKRFGSINEISV